jgi:serine/threonine protein kinase
MLGAAFLKIDYAAPEQYRTARAGKPEGEGPWTDIYGLGATMYYLLTGKKPTDVISRLSGKDTDLAPALEGKLEQSWIDLLQKAMELDATKRFSSVSAFRTEMIRIKE